MKTNHCNKDFLDLAVEISKFSPDPITKVGCVLVDKNYNVTSTGFNTVLDDISIDLTQLNRHQKRNYIIHAEMVALLNASSHIEKAYCTIAPCIECVKLLSFAGVKKIIYRKTFGSNKIVDRDKFNAFMNILSSGIITIVNENDVSFINDVSKFIKNI